MAGGEADLQSYNHLVLRAMAGSPSWHQQWVGLLHIQSKQSTTCMCMFFTHTHGMDRRSIIRMHLAEGSHSST